MQSKMSSQLLKCPLPLTKTWNHSPLWERPLLCGCGTPSVSQFTAFLLVRLLHHTQRISIPDKLCVPCELESKPSVAS